MRVSLSLRWAALAVLAVAGAGCREAASPSSPLVLTTAPDLAATVSSSRLESGNGPAGASYWYGVWVTIAPATIANAGVVVVASTPVYIRPASGLISRTTGAEIHAGDTIEVWRDTSVTYGAIEAPPGAPAYNATQVVILR